MSRPMTAEPNLLPLPGVKCWRAMKDRNGNVGYSDKPDPRYSESAGTDGLTWVRLDDHRAALQAYARACVSSATEALRAEVESERRLRIREEGLSRAWKARADFAEKGLNECAGRAARAEHRAELLAEALREVGFCGMERGCHPSESRHTDACRKARAALDQETTNG